jgi:riboflavin transporter FmnP
VRLLAVPEVAVDLILGPPSGIFILLPKEELEFILAFLG